MSGHSKWSTIKRQKGAADVKRGKLFSRLANVISAAAKQGGGDPDMNPRLRMAIEQARAENMPKDNIERSIKRGTGELAGAALEELRFEIYGPAGVGILADVLTDNRNRISGEMKALLSRANGKLAAAGAVAYQFVQRGVLVVPLTGHDREELELQLIDMGVADYQLQGDDVVVYTDPKDVSRVKAALEAMGLVVAEARISSEPTQMVAVTDPADARNILKLMESLEDLDDVTHVTANFDIPDELILGS